MIGIVVLSLLAAVTADHLTPYLPYPRVEEIRRVYPQEILRYYPFLDKTVGGPVVHRPLVNTPFPLTSTVYPAPVLPTTYPYLNRVAPVPYHDIRAPYFRDYAPYPFIDRLPHLPAPAPIIPELPLPAPPVPASLPLLPSPTPLVHHTPFTPFIPPSTLIAPLPTVVKEEGKVEDVKKDVTEVEKKEV